jgi:outer membrane protein TolC
MVRDWQTPLRKPWDLDQAQLMFSLQQTFPGKQKLDLRAENIALRSFAGGVFGHSPDAPIEIAGAYRVPAALPSTEELERLAIEHRPELASLRKQITRSEDQSQLARLALKPDLTLAAGYMLMPTGSSFRNAYMAELTMPLPSLNRGRHDGEAKQADAATDVARADLDARTSAVFLEIRQAQIALRSAQSRIKLYRDTLLPQAEANFSASASAYENNRGEFTNLIDSQNLLLDIRTAYYQALAAADASGAQLERSIGMPIPASPTTDSTPKRTTK